MAEIPEDARRVQRSSGEYVSMEQGTAARHQESQSYWSQAYEAYAIVRDTVSSTASWSW